MSLLLQWDLLNQVNLQHLGAQVPPYSGQALPSDQDLPLGQDLLSNQDLPLGQALPSGPVVQSVRPFHLDQVNLVDQESHLVHHAHPNLSHLHMLKAQG